MLELKYSVPNVFSSLISVDPLKHYLKMISCTVMVILFPPINPKIPH